MTMMIDRNPEGRETGEGFVDAVEDRTVGELLAELIEQIRLLRHEMTAAGLTEHLERPETHLR